MKIFKKDIAGVALVVVGTVWLFFSYAGFQFFDPLRNGEFRWAASLMAILPAVLIYFIFGIGLRVIPSAAMAIFTVSVLILINRVKTSLTGLPISWNDLVSGENHKIALTYVSEFQWLCLGLLFLAIGGLIGFKRERVIRSWRKRSLFYIPSFLLVGFLSFYPYLPNIFHLQKRVELKLASADVVYAQWDWAWNISRNGLLLHLIQTSRRTLPSSSGVENFHRLQEIKSNNADFKRPKDVFFILCEGCWFDERNFKEIFSQLNKFDPLKIRSISPVYGGGTVNSTFEMLTGLPAHGLLQGIIFQEYAQLISDSAVTMVSSMNGIGYTTYALHNYYRDFWQRPTIYSKFGFSSFLGIEDMNYSGSMRYPRDQVVLDKVIDILESQPAVAAFL